MMDFYLCSQSESLYKKYIGVSPVFSLREGYRFKYKELVKLNKNGEFACVRRVKVCKKI